MSQSESYVTLRGGPSRVRGPKTKLSEGNSQTMAVDPVNNVIAVGQFKRTPDNNVKTLFINRTDNGDVAPIGEIDVPGIIEGTRQGQYIDQMQTYPPKGLVIAAVPGGDYSWQKTDPFVGIWSIHGRGTVQPLFKLGGKKTTFLRPRGVVLIPRSKEIAVADMRENALKTFFVPEVFQ
jgi:hypothetical protein